jgi:hypothetical protein
MLLHLSTVYWLSFVVSGTAYISCIKFFSLTLQKEHPALWESLRALQANVLRVNHGKIFFSFMKRGNLGALRNPKLSRIAFWIGISGVFFGLSASTLYFYYILYLPYHK